MVMHTLLYLKSVTNKNLLYGTGNCPVLGGRLEGRGSWGRLDTCICMADWLPWWLGSKELTCNAGDAGSNPGLGRLQSMGLQRV